MSLEVFGGGDEEVLDDLVQRWSYSLRDDGKWRETDDESGLTDDEMWQYVWDRRESESEDMAIA